MDIHTINVKRLEIKNKISKTTAINISNVIIKSHFEVVNIFIYICSNNSYI